MSELPEIASDIPLVSVIIPVYNCQEYIEQCIQSVRNQTLADIEIICVNDGSTDNTGKILTELASHDCRIRVIDRANGGDGAARNTGLDAARGIFISFLDADDFIERDMLNKMVGEALKGSKRSKSHVSSVTETASKSTTTTNSEQTDATTLVSNDDLDDICDIVVCAVQSYNTQTGQSALMPWGCYWEAFPYGSFNAADNPDMIFRSFQNWAWNKLFSSEFIRREGLRFDEVDGCADLFFVMCALATAHTIRAIPEPLYHYRINNPTSNTSTSARAPLDFYKSFIHVRDWLSSRDAFNLVERAFKNWVIGSIFYNFSVIRSWSAFCELFEYLRADDCAALRELSLTDVPQTEYFFESDWRKMQSLLNAVDATGFLFTLYREACTRNDELTEVDCTYAETRESFTKSAHQLLHATKENLRRTLYPFRG